MLWWLRWTSDQQRGDSNSTACDPISRVWDRWQGRRIPMSFLLLAIWISITDENDSILEFREWRDEPSSYKLNYKTWNNVCILR